ncbi:DNA polymerase subunit beta [Candidatus Symbiobacter mobilis CR]|uniref:DNA polymerase subunit beta n=1 Tax=Candidatus Symbiobacter mobilis CR TaxID=946483 RepID=U5N769_9BURK|nr:DNA polymerase subunit beta [Candidatus Symbiobacter mobilis CR]
MRLTDDQARAVLQAVMEVTACKHLAVRVFGSRLDDQARGGDLDLLLEFAEPIEHPALLAAKVSARVSRVLLGRKVDVLLSAPNLQHFPIHKIAHEEGILL